MNDRERELIRIVCDGDIRLAQKQARIVLNGMTSKKDEQFQKNMLRKLDAKGDFIELPFNLQHLLLAEDMTNFPEARFLLREEERKAVEALDEKDVAISAEYMFTAEEILRHGETDIPEYMIFLPKGDFTYDGKITLIYGSDECLYGFAPSFERAFAKYHAEYDLIVGEGMFHCWPVFPVVKEARQGWDLMIRLIRTRGRRESE